MNADLVKTTKQVTTQSVKARHYLDIQGRQRFIIQIIIVKVLWLTSLVMTVKVIFGT